MSTEEKKIMSMPEVGDALLLPNESGNNTAHIQVSVEGRKYKTTYTKKFQNRKIWTAPNPNEIKSYIPGEVREILVKKGEKIKKGDTIMIYEAMKMKNIISAPFDAIVEEIFVKNGDKLPKGTTLALLAPQSC